MTGARNSDVIHRTPPPVQLSGATVDRRADGIERACANHLLKIGGQRHTGRGQDSP
jgi:hypothetical protein